MFPFYPGFSPSKNALVISQARHGDNTKISVGTSGGDPEKHDKWIVVTTINAPTEDIKALSQLKGWKVVVVGDLKTPEDWR